MNKQIYIFIACLVMTVSSFAQEIIELPISKSTKFPTWEGAEKEYFSEIWQTQVVTNVSKPTIKVFRPDPALANGTSVVICPGGGLYALSIDSEGNDVAKWLNTKGVTAFVLRYRLVPTKEDGVKQLTIDGIEVPNKAKTVLPLSAEDALNAIDYVRTNANSFGINPDKIGLMGFSAGGAVTMAATFSAEEKNKPNFIAPVYAWMEIVPDSEVPVDAPPAFIVCASDDPLRLAPASVKLYSDWLNKGKIAELHMYAKGGHGFGMRKQNLPSDTWIERFGEWLTVMGWMEQ
jgi:acetyl esterase/lipase